MEEEIDVRVEDNSSTPERTLGPIMYASWLLGVGVARPRNCPKWITLVLRAVHFGVCSVIVAYSAIDFANFGREFTSELFEIMYCMNETIGNLAAYYYVYHVIRHYDKWPELMTMLEQLDGNIGRVSPIDDRSLRIRQILAIVAVLLVGPVSLTIHVLYYYFTAPDQIFASDLLLYYTIAQSMMNGFVFDLLVYAIYHRFRVINGMIKGIDVTFGADEIAAKIRRIRKLHSETCSVIVAVNDIYGIDLLLGSTNAFIMVVAKLFRIYMSAAEQKSGFIVLNNVIWIIYGGQFVITCWVCTLTHREVDRIGLNVGEFSLNPRRSRKFDKINCFRSFRNERRLGIFNRPYGDPVSFDFNNFGMEERDRVREEINDFSLQLQWCRVAFTACDFFEMDNSLLTRFISVITTYLIILVQFYKPDHV